MLRNRNGILLPGSAMSLALGTFITDTHISKRLYIPLFRM